MRSYSLLAILALLFLSAPTAQGVACSPTGYSGLTAAMVNPGDLNGHVVDATGCDIGVYYAGTDATVSHATVYGAQSYGVFVNGDAAITNVDITDSVIHTIGDNPHNGNQRGVAIYYRAYYSTGSATGSVTDNRIYNYQKGGIVVNGTGSNVQVRNNAVEGLGFVTFIAQNGIQFGYGSSGSATKNTVSGHAYVTPSVWASGGILVVGGAGYGSCPDGNPCPYTTNVQILLNTLSDNDVGVFLSNWNWDGANYVAPDDQTNIKVVNNTISHDGSQNNGICYQAGVSVVGNNDKIINNQISGDGYTSGATTCADAFVVDADQTYAPRAKVHATK